MLVGRTFLFEGQAALAIPEENNQITIHVSSQHPTEIQHKVAEVLGRPFHDVQVEVRRMGGGFGGKESQQSPRLSCGLSGGDHRTFGEDDL